MDERIKWARARAAHDHPWFAHGLFSLIPIESSDPKIVSMKTMAVDRKWRMYYHPEIFDKWDIKQISAVMVHELCHLLRDHNARSRHLILNGSDALTWNIAADCEINDDLKSIGLPEGCVYPSTYNFKENDMAEVYYKQLKEQGKKVNIPNPMAGAGACGSAAGAGQHGDDEADGDPVDGDGDPIKGISDIESDVIKETVAREIVANKSRGNVPAGMIRWAEDKLKSHVPWRMLLSAAIRGVIGERMGMVNYSYQRPSRRQSAFGRVIMPCLKAPLPRVAIQIDTSGSMSEKDLAQAIAEVDGCFKQLGVTEVHVMSCDSAVGAIQKVRSTKQIQLVGGGGTDMGPGIKAASEMRPGIDFLVIVSDCCAVWGDIVPKFPVIVVRTPGYPQDPPEWVKTVIEIDDYEN